MTSPVSPRGLVFRGGREALTLDWAALSLGTRDDMNSSRDDLESHPTPTSDAHDGVNLRPGQTDEGGHGGMATREQEARQLETQGDDDKSAEGTTPEPPD